MTWTVTLHDEFDPEFDQLPVTVQDELLAMLNLLKTSGPQLGRPHADTLSGSRHANMKELRFTAGDGASPLHSIQSARGSFWSRATKAAGPQTLLQGADRQGGSTV
jgi:hypothetical protein